jgi:hypothetical protein
MLDECVILLALQVTGLGGRNVNLAEELRRGLHHPDWCDLLAELDQILVWLSGQLVRGAGVPIDLGLLPIDDIPQLPKTAQDALPVVALVLKRRQEALDSGASPRD